jgi:serine protease
MLSSQRLRALATMLAVLVFGPNHATERMSMNRNPFSPRIKHWYRHGVVPTLQAHAQLQSWLRSHEAPAAAAPSSDKRTLSYGGGIDGIGVTSGSPKVYLVVFGSQWGSQSTDANGDATFSGDTKGEVPRLQQLFKSLGTGGELWSGVMTQYCDGPSVPNKATKCPAGATHVAYPTAPVLAGIWFDNSKASPTSATGRELALEAIAAAGHFHNTGAQSNRYVQYVILSPPSTTPDGFNTPNQNFCAWHDYNGDASLPGGPVTSTYGDIAFTNFPYLTDAGTNCGASFVNGNAGELDGVTIVEGHEYAETITDQNPAGGWTNQTGDPTYNGQENGDECSWIAAGQPGGAANVKMGTASYPMQATWSNDTTGCAIEHAVVH